MEEVNEGVVIEERRKKIFSFLKRNSLWVFAVLLIALILGIYIRSLPMAVRPETGKPGLWDITTNNWTLGPDLDPWLFTRYAKTVIETGSLPVNDTMRNVPLGFVTTRELQMVTYAIVITNKIISLFGNNNFMYSAIIMPLIFFVFTIIAFFFFVRELFYKKNADDNNLKANVIALIATFLMIVTPVFLQRTLAGIPEKESVGFFFMFLAFFFFIKAWKSEKKISYIVLSIFAGIATALMGLTWGGVVYAYVSIAIASFAAFILNKVGKKEFAIYSLWLLFSVVITSIFTTRFPLKDMLQGLDTGFAFLVFLILLVHIIIQNTKIKDNRLIRGIKLPENLKSLIIAIVLVIILIAIVFGPGFIISEVKTLNQILFEPVTGRWKITVAENKQPYFNEWEGNFGPYLGSIPIIFWMFFIGSIVVFKKMLEKIPKRESWILTAFYVLFLFGLIFSRYSSSSILNGNNFISRMFYYVSILILAGAFLYYYMKYNKEGIKSFEGIEFEYLFLFSIFVLCLFTARSAVRLIMVLGTIAPIFAAYLPVSAAYKFKTVKNQTYKMIYGALAVLFIFLVIFSFYQFYNQIKSEAYNNIPTSYNQQWQKAMEWVRNSTPENSVFAHWWDYGYWVQSIGERATVTDGGNAIVWWNYLTGRLVLTGDNQKDALDFLYSHNTSHLLIDSSDLGKYGAFSSIGSDENYDRYSSGPITMIYDPKEIQETKNGTTRIYKGSTYIEEDIIYQENTTQIMLPGGKAAILGVIINTVNQNNSTLLSQPKGIFYYQGSQYSIPLRYAYFKDNLVDFKSGIEGVAYIIPRVQQTSIDAMGALVYVSPRITRGLLGQIYILDNALGKFPNFKIVHTENNLYIEDLKSRGYDLDEFSYFDSFGLAGPIKIWKVEYTGNEQVKQEYLDTDYTKYISWQL
jgi:asparagine N-glycosylation enzyme membrane subunit Stt3